MACPDCRGAASPFSKIWSWAIYDDRLKKYLHLFKYHGLSDALAALREDIVLFTLKHTDIKECSVIVPVPIHEARHEKRGFNQAAKIASLLSSYYGIPASSLLVKIRDTPPQHSLSRAERAKNVKDAFKPVYKNSLRGKSVLLVDDILTTGATMRECARELKKNGAKKVYGFTLSSAL
jgi:ComF family protein